MDPGNWATDLEGGARFGTALLWVLLMSNLMAVLLQTLSARLGVVTGFDLAQACRAEYPRGVNFVLWILAEIAIAACDLAEVVGTIIALKLLFGLPMIWGCLVTAFDTFLLLYIQKLGIRKMEAMILSLVAVIGGCFLIQIFLSHPDWSDVARGFWPTLPRGSDGGTSESLLVAISILGATVMPHNLYLHSALVQTRRVGDDEASKAQACRYNLFDSAIALNAAFFINAAILVLSASVFHRHGEVVASIEEAHQLLPTFLGSFAPILFGVALLCAGQSSTLTGTLAGQIVMEGYLDLRLAPWLRRLVTRLIALVPAVLVIVLAGERSTQRLLVLSQVVLSLQLSFAVVPLVHFTSSRKNMGRFATPVWGRVLAWITTVIIVGLNSKLVFDQVEEAIDWASGSSIRPLGIPLSYFVTAALVVLVGMVGMLLVWILVRPLVSVTPAWRGKAPVELDWESAMRPRLVKRVAIALERSAADAEIIGRAMGIARSGETKLLLLHVVDTPLAGVYGEDAADQHAGADARYMEEVARKLRERGFEVESVLLHGADRARELVKKLKAEPVDFLIVGSHGHGLFKDLVFGQTVDRVRHGLSIPMLIARPGGRGEG
jgi:manganese transport protein